MGRRDFLNVPLGANAVSAFAILVRQRDANVATSCVSP